ncbi:hypothetical protein ACK311_16345, partial [Aeromonas caviae]
GDVSALRIRVFTLAGMAVQLRRNTQKPTARWIFLCFGGIHEYSLGGEPAQVTDINTVQETIIDVLGPRYRQIYS